MRRPKNLLVQYKGGGYDGCFWEWNFFLFDADGKFHNIASSGYKGITTEAEALELLSKPVDVRYGGCADRYEYKLTSKKALHEFQSETSASLVAGVTAKVNEIYGKDIMYWECQECSRKQYDDEMFHDGYTGNGGIGVTMQGMLCMDCYSVGCCSHCGEYYEPGKLTYRESHGDDICEYCLETEQEKVGAE